MGLFGNDTAAAPAPQAPAQQAPAQTHQAQNMQALPGSGGGGMSLNPNIFNGMGQVRSGHNSEYTKGGRYLYRLDMLEMKPDRNGINMFVPSYTCVHIFSVEEGQPHHNLGEVVSSVSKQGTDYFMKDVKKVLTTACGVTDDQVEAADAFAACGYNPDGTPNGVKPLDGKYITIEVNNVTRAKKDKPGETYVVTNFHGTKTQEELARILTPEAVQQFYTLSDGTCILTQQA